MELKVLLTFEPCIRDSILGQFPHGPVGFSTKIQNFMAPADDFPVVAAERSIFERSWALTKMDWRIGNQYSGKV